MVGDVELPASTFYAFTHAEVTPDGDRVLLVATTDAMLTIASVLTLLDPATLALEVLAEVEYGDVEATAWSADGSFLAYTLGSARARARGIATDASGNVYITGDSTGAFDGGNAGDFDAFIRSFDGGGNLRWTRQFGSCPSAWSRRTT
jgi:hypothetical protein